MSNTQNESESLRKDLRVTMTWDAAVKINQTELTEYLLSIPTLQENDEAPSAWVNHYPGFLRLSSLFVPEPFRRLGCARALVREAIRAADRVGLPMYLDALPYADRPMSIDQLIAFYESCGMQRFPGHPTSLVHDPREVKRGGPAPLRVLEGSAA